MAHIYEVGTRAWQPDPTEGWVASEVKEKLVDGEKVQLVFELENGEVGLILHVFAADHGPYTSLLSDIETLTRSGGHRPRPLRLRSPNCRSTTIRTYHR